MTPPAPPAAPNFAHLHRAAAVAPRSWLVSGAAGFIGSSLVQQLLALGQRVVGLDNFSTGHQSNLDDVRDHAGPAAWSRFTPLRGDVRDPDDCRRAVELAAANATADAPPVVLHQAALGSVPHSIADPLTCHQSNVDGFVNLLLAAKAAGVRRFVYASSSAVYGDEPTLPKVESRIGRALSPYAVSKYVDELYASVFALNYGLECVGLRYFNVFGPRQDPNGAYAAVIPRWIAQLIAHQPPTVNGDGSITRDFCYVDNVVRANLLAGLTPRPDAVNQVYNIAVGGRMTLNELFGHLRDAIAAIDPRVAGLTPIHGPPRAGDIIDSQADVTKAKELLGYEPVVAAREGLEKTVKWFAREAKPTPGR